MDRIPAPVNSKPRVLMVYRGKRPGMTMIPSVRLCGHSQLELLAEKGVIEYRAIEEYGLRTEDLNWSQIVLLGRLDDWYGRRIAWRLRKTGRYVIYILDDDLLNIPRDNSNAIHFGLKATKDNILGTLQSCHAILSPSPLLLEKYAKDGRRGMLIEEPAVNPVEYTPKEAREPVRIGFAGSIDRVQDIENLLRETLFELRTRYRERIDIAFFGAIPSFSEALGARRIPYCEDYFKYRGILNDLQWDIGLAPMPETAFHACKHYNKFCEYAAAGTVGIYSDVEPYIRAKEKYGVGIWCDNTPQAWIKSVSELIDEPWRRLSLREALFNRVLPELSVEQSAERLWKQLGDIRTDAVMSFGSGRLRLYKTGNYLRHVSSVFRMYGLKTPGVACQKIRERFTQMTIE